MKKKNLPGSDDNEIQIMKLLKRNWCFTAVFLNCQAVVRFPDPGNNYTGARKVLLEFVILVF